MDITWKAGSAAVVVSLPQGIKVSTNDLAADQYRKVISLQVPRMTTKVLVTSHVQGASWLEAGELVADAYADIYSAPVDYLSLNAAQIAFVEEQDRATKRVKRMVAGLRGSSDGNFGAHYMYACPTASSRAEISQTPQDIMAVFSYHNHYSRTPSIDLYSGNPRLRDGLQIEQPTGVYHL